MANINRVVLVGNLTRDPELRHTAGGTAVCKLRVAVNTRQKDQATGEWGDKPNYFDVTVWGNQGESCAQFLSKRQAVEIIADNVQFLGSREGGGEGSSFVPQGAAPATAANADFGPTDDDIPF